MENGAKPDLSKQPDHKNVTPDDSPITIIGAGLAGCWTARLLAEEGYSVCLVDKQQQIARGASGTPVGIFKPYVTRQPSAAMAFYCAAYICLRRELERLNIDKSIWTDCGVVQLVHRAYPQHPTYQVLNSSAASCISDVAINSPGLHFPGSGWLKPGELCNELVKHPNIERQLTVSVTAIKANPFSKNKRWCVSTDSLGHIQTDNLILTTGHALDFAPYSEELTLTPARGQLSRFHLTTLSPKCVINGKRYAIPDNETIYAGASFDRNDTNLKVRQSDHDANREGLLEFMPDLKLSPKAMSGFVGIRATTPDRMPVIGPWPDFIHLKNVYRDIQHGKVQKNYPPLPVCDGLFVVSGLGSRGIVTAPFAARLLVNHLTRQLPGPETRSPDNDHQAENDPPTGAFERQSGCSSEDDLSHWFALVNPARFLIKRLKRGEQ